MGGSLDGWVDGWMVERFSRLMGGWIDGWKDGAVGGGWEVGK
jgi:hypothetical protein